MSSSFSVPPGWRGDGLAAEIDVGVAALGDEHRAERRARRHRRDERLGDRRDLRVDDFPRLLRAFGKRHLALDARQPRAVVGHVEQARLDRPAGCRGRPARRVLTVAGADGPNQRGADKRQQHAGDGDQERRARHDRGSSRGHLPPPACESRNLMIASVIACTKAFWNSLPASCFS